MPCSHEDFELTVTDAGVCYTFNAQLNNNSKVNATETRFRCATEIYGALNELRWPSNTGS